MGDNPYLNGILQDLLVLRELPKFQDLGRALFGDSLLAQLQEEYPRNSSATANDLISIAFGIEQRAMRIWRGGESEGEYRAQAKVAFEVAAKIFEQVAESRLIASTSVNRDLYFHSAIAYSLGEFQANATVLARKVLSRDEFGDDPHGRVLKATFLLLRRTPQEVKYPFGEAYPSKEIVDKAIRVRVRAADADQAEAAEEIGHLIVLEALSLFCDYLRLGRDQDFGVAQSKIEAALLVFDTIKDPDNYVMVQLISLLIQQMHYSSLWHQLGDLWGFRANPVLTRYILALTLDKVRPTYELWDSQIAALPKVLGAAKTLVLQMPTSAGKTRVAEIALVFALATSGTDGMCIYVAPYKSLASQVEETLSRALAKVGFRVASVFGSYESIDIEELLTEQMDVLVITPEKLDYLFRVQRDIFQRIKVLVVDEGHIVGNDIRGLRLELLLQRIKKEFTDGGSHILFISAVVPNVEEIAAWLGNGEPSFVRSQWKPTRLRQGIFYWANDWKGKVRYREERVELETGLERRLIREFHKTRPDVRLKHPVYYPDSVYEIAVELALAFMNASPTIIFTAVRTHVDSVAAKISQRISELRVQNPEFRLAPSSAQADLNGLAERIERRLGKGFPLASYVREGFAFHHGLLPDDIRTAIEDAFRNESVRILIATPTLAQGVNLPVHLMIVANLERGAGYPFLIRDFRNIAGRAGRALHETEGHVIFVQNTQSSWLVGQMYKYLRDDRIEAVESVLFEVYRRLVRRKLGISLERFLEAPHELEVEDADVEDLDGIDVAFQTQILALLYEGLIQDGDRDSIRSLIDKSLFGTQWRIDRVFYEPLVELATSHVKYIQKVIGSARQRSAFYRTGLGVKSCLALEAELRLLSGEAILQRIREGVSGPLKDIPLARILQLVPLPVEVRVEPDIQEYLPTALVQWMNYGDISGLSLQFKDVSPSFADPVKVSNIVARHFINDAPWVLNAVVHILEFLNAEEGIQYDPEIAFLPAYAKYGVNSPMAAHVCGLGLADRNVARRMAEEYYKESTSASLLVGINEFRDWVRELSFEGLLALLEDPRVVREVWTVVRRRAPEPRPAELFMDPHDVVVITHVVGLQYEGREALVKRIRTEGVLRLVREPDNPFDPNALAVFTEDGAKLGYVGRSKAFGLSTLLDEGIGMECRVKAIQSDKVPPGRRILMEIRAIAQGSGPR